MWHAGESESPTNEGAKVTACCLSTSQRPAPLGENANGETCTEQKCQDLDYYIPLQKVCLSLFSNEELWSFLLGEGIWYF